MNINEIAKTIITLRENKMSGYIMAGVLREQLGFDGYKEALRQRWIEADMEQSGMVTITNNLGKIDEIRKLAAECKSKCGNCKKSKCDCSGRCDSCDGEKCTCSDVEEAYQPKTGEKCHCKKGTQRDNCPDCEGTGMKVDFAKIRNKNKSKDKDDSDQQSFAEGCDNCVKESAHHLAVSHAFRKSIVVETQLVEIATRGLGNTGDAPTNPIPGLSSRQTSPPPSTQQQRQAQTTSTQRDVAVGSDATVVENGKSYTGKVSKALPDGKYEISFAGEQPPAKRAYDKTEVNTSFTKQ